MELMTLKCPACGGAIDGRITGRAVTCEYCGTRFVLDGEGVDSFIEGAEEAFEEEDELSSLSMVEFAEEACADFLYEFDNGSSFKETKKILRGLDIGDDEEVFLIHDDTMLKSGKNGFAITDCGLYCRDMGGEVSFYDWEEFSRFREPTLDGSYVTCGNRHVCYFTDDDDLKSDLLDLYDRLHYHAQGQF